jgi:hypothetical protein
VDFDRLFSFDRRACGGSQVAVSKMGSSSSLYSVRFMSETADGAVASTVTVFLLNELIPDFRDSALMTFGGKVFS